MRDPAVDAYLAALPGPQRELLEHVRSVIHDASPELGETISYGMPAFERNGTKLVWFAAFKAHCSLYPASAKVRTALGPDLAPYVHEKSTIRFSTQHPLTDELVRRLVAVRIEETSPG
ncbi:MAG TPA: DUF1801 domain-containing protein [Solirubrobacterales bacterium]